MDVFLDQIAADDAITMIVTLGESVEYRPYNGVPRTIQAIIDRKFVNVPSVQGRPNMQMTCSTDPVSGIDPATADFAHDKVYVLFIPGKPNDKDDSPYGFNPRSANAQTTGVLEITLT